MKHVLLSYIVIFVPKIVSFHANDKFYVTNNVC
jgi:hypothetical protein